MSIETKAALQEILQIVQAYLPPDGIQIEQAMSQIIARVDPWPAETDEDEVEVAFAEGYASGHQERYLEMDLLEAENQRLRVLLDKAGIAH